MNTRQKIHCAAIGGGAGLLAWMWQSALPERILKWGAGFGWGLVLGLLVCCPLVIAVHLDPERFSRLGAFLVWQFEKARKAGAVFFWLAATAFLCWLVTGSSAAMGVVLLSLLIGGGLRWCTAQLDEVRRDALRRLE